VRQQGDLAQIDRGVAAKPAAHDLGRSVGAIIRQHDDGEAAGPPPGAALAEKCVDAGADSSGLVQGGQRNRDSPIHLSEPRRC
jgi:hypothetical protein